MIQFLTRRRQRRARRRARVVATSSTALQLAYLYAGQPEHFDKWLGRFVADEKRRELLARCYERLFANVTFFWIPAGIVKVVLREDLSDYGLRVGKWWKGIPMLVAGAPLTLIGAWFASGQKAFQDEYPLSKTARGDALTLALYEGVNFQYYVGWEFFYRGYLQLGLEEAWGVEAATAYQTIASTLMHIGKPRDETVGAALGGPIFGWMSRSTGSVLYPLAVHWWLGLATDLACWMRAPRPAPKTIRKVPGAKNPARKKLRVKTTARKTAKA